VLEQLDSADPVIRPMFGCYAIYVRGRLVLILRLRDQHKHDNGVWLATSEEFHAELKLIFPCLRSIRLLGKKSAWQNIPVNTEDFETFVMKACEMILKNDPRIGKVTKPKNRRKSS
jgi:hypothetical protein